ncbi:hypothetical protein E6R60_26565 [Streptomyces sp. A0642]|uniref:hypothetical protein n=1 Tax=Streptomyces sp. A0642 TaxID=2563100 RepID=UPI0010A24904|nr:hypothetical protein [Streptomyces sp. A0642]THA72496.1 hypothetical protein E6R60_26565 [Streptomyces sp. A0642]
MPDAGARRLPPPIKPRVLKRRRNPIFGFDYYTSDGRYQVTPRYADTPNGGRTARVDRYQVTDLRVADPARSTRDHHSLDDVRESYCSRYVPWLVCDMDMGVLRVASSRKEAVGWASIYAGSPVTTRHPFVPGSNCYEYDFDGTGLFIMAADVAHRHGLDPVQQPLFPYPNDPYEEVDRPVTLTMENA